MEHAMLRSAPRLYKVAAWAKAKVRDKPHLRPLLQEFRRLRKLLWDAPVAVNCDKRNRKRIAGYMSLAEDWHEHYLRPGTLFWCYKHGPSRSSEDDEADDSPKMPLHFDALKEPAYGDPKSQKVIHLAVLEGLGIDKKPTRIREDFARRYFAKLSRNDGS
jgi:hypothetical protein